MMKALLICVLFSFSSFTLAIGESANLPEVNFSYSSQDVSEGQDVTVSAEITVPSSLGVIIPFVVTGSANDSDHDLINGLIYISPNHTKGSITFRVFNDQNNEGSETITIKMLAPQNASLGQNSIHTIIIHDYENLPEINFSTNSSLNREGHVENIEVSLSEPSSQIVIVPYTVSGTATFPTDHNAISGNFVFFPGSTKANLSIILNQDNEIEEDESIIINLKAPVVNAILGGQTVHVLTIQGTYPGIKLEGVNKTSNTVINDNGNMVAKLELLAGSNPVGGFNGSGTGNKAYLGIKYNVPVFQFEKLVFKSKVPSASSLNKNVYVNFQIDLNCNPLNPDYAIVVVDFMFASPGPQNQWNTYTLNSSDQQYRSVGGKGGLPSHISSQKGFLSTLVNNFPNACFVNASTGDNGQKKNAILPSILLVLGDSGTTTASQVYLDDIEVSFNGDLDLYNFETIY